MPGDCRARTNWSDLKKIKEYITFKTLNKQVVRACLSVEKATSGSQCRFRTEGDSAANNSQLLIVHLIKGHQEGD